MCLDIFINREDLEVSLNFYQMDADCGIDSCNQDRVYQERSQDYWLNLLAGI